MRNKVSKPDIEFNKAPASTQRVSLSWTQAGGHRVRLTDGYRNCCEDPTEEELLMLRSWPSK